MNDDWYDMKVFKQDIDEAVEDLIDYITQRIKMCEQSHLLGYLSIDEFDSVIEGHYKVLGFISNNHILNPKRGTQ